MFRLAMKEQGRLVTRHVWESKITGHWSAYYDGPIGGKGEKRRPIIKHVCHRCGETRDTLPMPWWTRVKPSGDFLLIDCETGR